ncbi:MAG: polysaccharide deacetylase family protein [Candidatus Rokubacteria bacterium]|nr:polysaccharide deacetylase family protein [Candidatus Rokubacteria bacterium]
MSSALYHTGLLPVLRAGSVWGTSGVFQVLTYHRVNDEADPFFPAVRTAVFEEHMAYVARTYRVLTVEEAHEGVRRRMLPRGALAITFDDGYRDNLTHAAPILARYGLPATVFVATGFVGGAEVPWFDRLALAFKETREQAITTAWGDTFALTTVQERLDALARVITYFKRLPDDHMRREADRLLGALGVTGRGRFKNLMLNWDDVHALTGLGFSIGAHTVNHPILSRVCAERAWTEIIGSRTMIRAACGRLPKAFAYPNGYAGDYTETVKHMVREAGFSCAVTSRFGLNTLRTPAFELRRGGPWEEHLPTFAVKLAAYRLAGLRGARRAA